MQRRIAKAKNVDKATVSRRLRFNDMPDKVKEFINRGLIQEVHCIEIGRLSIVDILSSWLTPSQAWEELAERLKFNTLSDKMKQFIGKGVLDEFHLREIYQLSVADNFPPGLPLLRHGRRWRRRQSTTGQRTAKA